MKTQTNTPTLSSGRARAERCKELEEEKESNATEYGARDSQEVETEPKKTTSRTDPREGDGWKATDEAARPKALWCSGSMLPSHARGPGFNPRAG